MFCKNCGREVDDNAIICPACGVLVGEIKKEKNVLALIGFILSFFVPLAGLICSIIARKKCREEHMDGESLALAGIIISAIELAISVIAIVFCIIYFTVILSLISSSDYYTLALVI